MGAYLIKQGRAKIKETWKRRNKHIEKQQRHFSRSVTLGVRLQSLSAEYPLVCDYELWSPHAQQVLSDKATASFWILFAFTIYLYRSSSFARSILCGSLQCLVVECLGRDDCSRWLYNRRQSLNQMHKAQRENSVTIISAACGFQVCMFHVSTHGQLSSVLAPNTFGHISHLALETLTRIHRCIYI